MLSTRDQYLNLGLTYCAMLLSYDGHRALKHHGRKVFRSSGEPRYITAGGSAFKPTILHTNQW